MIKPLAAHDELLADIASVDPAFGGFHAWWLGQSGLLVSYQGRHLLFDPYLSDSLTKKYAETDKPHVRMTELVVDPARLDFVDVVTSSHNHTDHLDHDTLAPLIEASPQVKVLVPSANRDFAADRLKVDPARLQAIDAGESIEFGPFTLHAVPAAHETVERDDEGRCKFVGYVAQFGDWTVYHSGDTLLYDGMEETLRQWDIDLAMLPINGRKPERRVAGNLNGRQAAQLAHDCGMKLVVPCHYDMFEFNTETPDEFVAACDELGVGYRVMRCGERVTLPA